MSILSKEQCKETLLKECKVEYIEGKYRGHNSTGYLVSRIPNLLQSIIEHTSFLPKNCKNKERFYCILHDIDSVDKIKKCFCGNLNKLRTIEQGYTEACCREHLYTVRRNRAFKFFETYKLSNEIIIDKESLIFFYKKQIDKKYKTEVFNYDNIEMFNSLLYYTKDIISIEKETLLDYKTIEQRVYHLINNIKEIPVCIREGCRNKTHFITFAHGYTLNCSKTCGSITKVEKTIKTNNERYGGNGPTCNPEIVKKGKDTKKRHFGNENYNNRESAKQTCVDKYGVDNPFKSKEIMEKVQQERFERTGYRHQSQNPEVQEKTKQIYFEKTGYEHSSQNPKVRKKFEKTCLERYGVTNPVQNKEISLKIKITSFLKYGPIHPRFKYNKYSKVSQELFDAIYEKLPEKLKQECYYATCKTDKKHQKEFVKYDKENNTSYFYDFVLSHLKLVIEFDGIYWHSKEHVKERDLQKQKFIESLGFKIIRVDEKDYYEDKEKVIEYCLNEIREAC